MPRRGDRRGGNRGAYRGANRGGNGGYRNRGRGGRGGRSRGGNRPRRTPDEHAPQRGAHIQVAPGREWYPWYQERARHAIDSAAPGSGPVGAQHQAAPNPPFQGDEYRAEYRGDDYYQFAANQEPPSDGREFFRDPHFALHGHDFLSNNHREPVPFPHRDNFYGNAAPLHPAGALDDRSSYLSALYLPPSGPSYLPERPAVGPPVPAQPHGNEFYIDEPPHSRPGNWNGGYYFDHNIPSLPPGPSYYPERNAIDPLLPAQGYPHRAEFYNDDPPHPQYHGDRYSGIRPDRNPSYDPERGVIDPPPPAESHPHRSEFHGDAPPHSQHHGDWDNEYRLDRNTRGLSPGPPPAHDRPNHAEFHDEFHDEVHDEAPPLSRSDDPPGTAPCPQEQPQPHPDAGSERDADPIPLRSGFHDSVVSNLAQGSPNGRIRERPRASDFFSDAPRTPRRDSPAPYPIHGLPLEPRPGTPVDSDFSRNPVTSPPIDSPVAGPSSPTRGELSGSEGQPLPGQDEELHPNDNMPRHNSHRYNGYRPNNEGPGSDRRRSRDEGNRRNDNNRRNDGNSNSRNGGSRHDGNRYNDGNRNDGNRHNDNRRDNNAQNGRFASGNPPVADTYRPPQGEFTFQQSAPSGMNFGANNHQQDGGQSHQGRRDRAKGRDRPGRPVYRGGRLVSRGGFRPAYPANRELLTATHTTDNETILFNPDSGVSYRPLDELTDSDEAEMEMSGEEGGEPSTKRARRPGTEADGDSEPKFAPRWSNPDPYTALPPVETTSSVKKKDVVQLIRKARIQTGESRPSLPAAAEEFISFDADSSEEEEDGEPSGSKATSAAATPATPGPSSRGVAASAQTAARSPVGQDVPLAGDSDSALGSRKRTHDDHIKEPMYTRPYIPVREAPVLPEWRMKSDEDPTPWFIPHDDAGNAAQLLHLEINDFYTLVSPTPFEVAVRKKFVEDIKSVVRRNWKDRDAEVYSFGSYPTGLYLPTSDMDMVLCSDSLLNRGQPKYTFSSFSKMREFANLLQRHRYFRKIHFGGGTKNDGDCEIIKSAKVPIIKFTDEKTGFNVDISSEQINGLRAIDTFLAWKAEFTLLPVMVTVIKHLLCMHGLNEPATGGIGGLAVTCLVVSLMQIQHRQDGTLFSECQDLGELLLGFLDYYGNHFEYTRFAISVNPPALLEKEKVTTVVYKNNARLSILDPNNNANDICGGSKRISDVLNLFRSAHAKLIEEMQSRENGQGGSILRVILGGDYSSFRYQRARCAKLSGLDRNTGWRHRR